MFCWRNFFGYVIGAFAHRSIIFFNGVNIGICKSYGALYTGACGSIIDVSDSARCGCPVPGSYKLFVRQFIFPRSACYKNSEGY